MNRTKRWNIVPADPAANELAARLKTSVLLAQVLINRGLRESQECQEFLQPSLNCLHEPFSIANLRLASGRIAQAIRDRQKIVIYGDYDVDGITATAILWHAIRVLGGSCEYYIPRRLEEGYGLNSQAIAQICEAGAQLIISVDCGITAIEPAKIAKDRGVDLIITDHHDWHVAQPPPDVAQPPSAVAESPTPVSLPDCFAVVHPRLWSDQPPYQNPYLCGAGVAFKLAWGIGLAVSGAPKVSPEFREFLIEATALAALGTIADVVPLIGENRALAHFGLSCLKASKLVGIAALIASAGLLGKKLDSFDAGFLLAPRLNASGRMGHAALAVEMLTSANLERAHQIAAYLEQQNRERQAIEKKIFDQAMDQIKKDKWDQQGKCAIVLGDQGWHPGVIGIVASRIVDRFHRPTIMVALNNGHGQGSGRSIAGFHLARALEACGQCLEAFGGHEMAAGLKVQTSRFDDFRRSFCEHAGSVITEQMLVPQLQMEGIAQIRQLSVALVGDLERLGPFGHANPRPVFCLRGVEISGPPRRVGKTLQHLQLYVRQDNHFMKCIAFGQGERCDQFRVGSKIDLAVEPCLNEYNENTSVELEVRDVQFDTI